MNARGSQDPWIAARFDNTLPGDFLLGDNIPTGNGDFVNRPLLAGHQYRLFVRAFTADSVRYYNISIPAYFLVLSYIY